MFYIIYFLYFVRDGVDTAECLAPASVTVSGGAKVSYPGAAAPGVHLAIVHYTEAEKALAQVHR